MSTFTVFDELDLELEKFRQEFCYEVKTTSNENDALRIVLNSFNNEVDRFNKLFHKELTDYLLKDSYESYLIFEHEFMCHLKKLGLFLTTVISFKQSGFTQALLRDISRVRKERKFLYDELASLAQDINALPF